MAGEGSREPLEIEERGSVLLFFLWEVLSSRFTVPHLLSNELFTPLFFTLQSRIVKIPLLSSTKSAAGRPSQRQAPRNVEVTGTQRQDLEDPDSHRDRRQQPERESVPAGILNFLSHED